MRAHGLCLLCQRYKRINIRPSQLEARIPYGECDDCLDRQRTNRRASGSSQPQPRKDKK